MVEFCALQALYSGVPLKAETEIFALRVENQLSYTAGERMAIGP
jgi:hypothetical protein